MFRSPKSSLFRPWVELSSLKKTNGDRRALPLPDGDASEERRANIKRAWFFATVALLFVLADLLGHRKTTSDSNDLPVAASSVSLTLSPHQGPRDGNGFFIRFRLSNRGNHPVFYPVRSATSEPIGQLVARTTLLSDWISLSSTSAPRLPAVHEDNDPNLTWIEMPPGGWADGEFFDSGDWTGEHAYAIFLKPSRNAGTVRILSEPYGSGRK